MTILKLNSKHFKPVVLVTTLVFLVFAILFFLPGFQVPRKVVFPLMILTIAALWVLPWQMCLAMFFSFLGDYFGACNNFLAQMGFFALAHVWIIVYFVKRLKTNCDKSCTLSNKRKAYFSVISIATLALLVFVMAEIVPFADAGVIRYGVIIYAILISTMMFLGLIQRSYIFALGGFLFVFSDFVLAWNKFVSPVPARTYMVMVPYYSAQFLLFLGAAKYMLKELKGIKS